MGGGNNEVKNAVNNGFTMAVMAGVIMEANNEGIFQGLVK